MDRTPAEARTIGTEVTRLLVAWRESQDATALDELVPLVYDELRAIAARRLAAERPDHTLQPTALVHEAYARLWEGETTFANRAHFFAIAARTMRRILVDHARARGRVKRGDGGPRVTLTENSGASEPTSFDVLALDEALEALAGIDRRKAQVVELHFFGGLSYAETSTALGISEATVDRDLRLAKAWLGERLS